MKVLVIKVEDIYIPAARRKEMDPQKRDDVSEKMLEDSEPQRPIQVRQGDGRFVLVKGIHRLEASKALGETTIQAYLVGAKQH